MSWFLLLDLWLVNVSADSLSSLIEFCGLILLSIIISLNPIGFGDKNFPGLNVEDSPRGLEEEDLSDEH